MVDTNSAVGRHVGALARKSAAPTVRVTQGQIPVNSVDVILDTNSVLVLEADTRSKYAGDLHVGHGEGGGTQIDLFAGGDTLNAVDTTEPTEIHLPGYTAGWLVLTDWARHTVRIVAYKPGQPVTAYDVSRDGGSRS